MIIYISGLIAIADAIGVSMLNTQALDITLHLKKLGIPIDVEC